MFYCLDRFIDEYGLHGPFLEIGCGVGDVSAYLAAKGWTETLFDQRAIIFDVRPPQPGPKAIRHPGPFS